MEQNVSCWVEWCHGQPQNHRWHEGVITTLGGHDPHLQDTPRWAQLVAYAQEPPGHTGPLTPRIALTITGPDLSRPDRVSVALDREDWRDMATEIRKTLTIDGDTIDARTLREVDDAIDHIRGGLAALRDVRGRLTVGG